MAKKKQLPANAVQSEAYVKDFFDMVVPSTIKFNIDHSGTHCSMKMFF